MFFFQLIKLANEVLLNPTEENLMSFPEGYGAIFDWKALPSKLSVKEANNFFQTMWYGKGKKYDYDNEPLNTDAGIFIVQDMMFIIIFLELLVNCYIKYRNKLTIYMWVLF